MEKIKEILRSYDINNLNDFIKTLGGISLMSLFFLLLCLIWSEDMMFYFRLILSNILITFLIYLTDRATRD